MNYITFNKNYRERHFTFDDLFNGIDPNSLHAKDTHDTITLAKDCFSVESVAKIDLIGMYQTLVQFNNKYSDLISEKNKGSLYRSFKIPKRTRGLRKIDTPNPPLMDALSELKRILEEQFYFTYHTSTFSYAKGRCTVDAVRRHRDNGSRWVLKTDISKFFPNTTPEFLFSMIYRTFPLCEFVKRQDFREAFEKAMSLCFLNGGLPQGTPTSPMLTNQMMIPIDYTIAKMCRTHKPYLCYTRYSDDMDFSSKYDFKWSEVVAEVSAILQSFSAPFKLNREKIHYGSTSGRNWMLGVMLNKDGNITVGHENKKTFKTCLFAFGNSIKDGTPWSIEDTQHLMGLTSYYKMVEGETIDNLIQKYSDKFGFSILEKMKQIIKGNI